ncbi:MAG: 4-alpha-glucanotransferase [Myxococcales bacterium]|nr:4-alpha-glucanotransferase [Myxococcales bacterium]
MTDGRPRLRALADRLGIEDGYRSAIDRAWVPTRDRTREALAAAMGWDASSEAAAAAALAELGEWEFPATSGVRCVDVDAKLGGRRAFGIGTHLYTLRSRANWGFGNFGDLRALIAAAAAEGAAFVGINPLHALANRTGDACPYAPVSRIFRNPLYLDPAAIPDLPHCAAAQRRLESADHRTRIDALRAAGRLDPAGVDAALRAVLVPLHACFRDRRGADADERRRAYARFRDEQGQPLTDFATFVALAEHLEPSPCAGDWRRWSESHRTPQSAGVGSFRDHHEREIDFHAWLQFELDRQLAGACATARDVGLPIGVYADLALGSAPGGSDTWTWPGLFASGVTVGAPPDGFSRSGQDWGFPPLDPHALRRDGFAFWARLLDANTRHVGALRIDHALGLRRLFWIPEGGEPRDGAYVRYPEAELLAAIGRASRERDVLMIAEDLGTVPEGFDAALRDARMLSSRVLLFERDDAGFRPAAAYPRACLATANTHDLPPLLGFAGESDLLLRRRAGQIPDDATLELLREERRRDRRALQERLVRDGFLDAGGLAAGPDALAAAVVRFLCASPAALVGLSLDDLAGESEPLNLPGVPAARHPSWTRRTRVPLEELFCGPTARLLFDCVPDERRRIE